MLIVRCSIVVKRKRKGWSRETSIIDEAGWPGDQLTGHEEDRPSCRRSPLLQSLGWWCARESGGTASKRARHACILRFAFPVSYIQSAVLNPQSRYDMPEPIAKKRKLDTARQDSFSHVLQQLEAEEDASAGLSRSPHLLSSPAYA